jgi:hypothetical protein
MKKANFIPNTTPELEVVYVRVWDDSENPNIETSRIVGWQIAKGECKPVTASHGVIGCAMFNCNTEFAEAFFIQDNADGTVLDIEDGEKYPRIAHCIQTLRNSLARHKQMTANTQPAN